MKHNILIAVMLYLITSTRVNAQSNFPSQYLDINQVKARISYPGANFLPNDTSYLIGYEVPKGSGKMAIYCNPIWLGGIDEGGQLHVAAQTYRQGGVDFWYGPLDTITGSTTPSVSSMYNRVWKINRFDIENFKAHFAAGDVQNGNFVPAQDILEWPARGTGNYTRNMAPFVDQNNNGIYDPLVGGDYPLIKGDQMLYSIYNDNLAPHTESGGAAFKVEVHASAYAFACDSLPDSLKSINYTTFYKYEFFNRSNHTYSNAYIGNYSDYDVGNPYINFTGCNAFHNTNFCYNA
jgi:hypothetical protein